MPVNASPAKYLQPVPAVTQGCQPQRNILKVKKMFTNLKKFYKYLKKLQIFSLNISMCSEIVFSLCTKLLQFKRNCSLRTSGRGRRPSPQSQILDPPLLRVMNNAPLYDGFYTNMTYSKSEIIYIFAGSGRIRVRIRFRLHLRQYGVLSADHEDARDAATHVHQGVLSAAIQGALEMGGR